jgi:hypothetical protein
MSALPNLEGSSDTSPAAASPTIPTPFALPIPGRIAARAAPKSAMLLPVKIVESISLNVIFNISFDKFYIF